MPANATNVIVLAKRDLADKCVRISGSNYERSWQTRWNRRAKNLANWNAYWSRMDWSHKLPFQTTQCIAEFGISIEQSVGTLERGLTDTEDWLTVDAIGIGEPPIDPDTIALWMKYHLQRLWQPGNLAETAYGISNFVGDAVKRGLLESIVTAKVYGVMDTKYHYRLVESRPVRGKFGHRDALASYRFVEQPAQRVQRDEVRNFRLCYDLIPWEDYFPDPSPLNKWTCHEVTMHLSELASNPDFDPEVIDAIRGTAEATYADMYKRVTQDVVFISHEPDEVRVREFWGDLIDPTNGEVLATNCFWTLCNGRLLRPPTPNPFWHGYRPFVSAPLFRNPNSTVHKALADDAVDSWQFLNELISLMFDGALGSVWGKYQARMDQIENSDDFQQGIPQSAVFALRPSAPEGTKALEKIDQGELPAYAMQIYDMAMRQFQTAMATNDLKLGQQPAQETTATSIVEAMQAAGSLFESIAARVEDTFLEPCFELGWMVMLQYELAEKLVDPKLVQILGPERVLQLTQMTNQERFVLLASAARFKIRGLRGVASRNRILTKLANLVQLMGTNPQMAELFGPGGKYSMTRLGEQLIRNSGVDPSTLEKTQQERDADEAQQMVQEAMNAGGVTAPPAPESTPPAAGGTPGGSPPALMDASQDQQGMSTAMAPKTPGGQIPGAPTF